MVRSIPLDQWPEPDRRAWVDACRPCIRLQRGGRAAHLKPITRADLARRYGYFLDFLKRRGSLSLIRSATEQVTPHRVSAYIEELRGRVGSVTLHGSIYKLRRAVEIINPDPELTWLKDIERDLNDCKRPRSKAHRLVFSDKIVAEGIALMERAEGESRRTKLQRATDARDGLMIALLAVCPTRLKNFHALAIGTSFVREGDQWWIVLADNETKSHRHDQRAVPGQLTPWIDSYIEKHRPVFPSCADALWPSRYGGAMTYLSVESRISTITLRTIGHAISPHLFRHCAPYTIANKDGSKMHLASALLQHTDPRTTERHYNFGHSVESSKIFASLVSSLRTSSDRRTNREDTPLSRTDREDLKGHKS